MVAAGAVLLTSCSDQATPECRYAERLPETVHAYRTVLTISSNEAAGAVHMERVSCSIRIVKPPADIEYPILRVKCRLEQ